MAANGVYRDNTERVPCRPTGRTGDPVFTFVLDRGLLPLLLADMNRYLDWRPFETELLT